MASPERFASLYPCQNRYCALRPTRRAQPIGRKGQISAATVHLLNCQIGSVRLRQRKAKDCSAFGIIFGL
jgi:hypothetical protein